MTCDMTINFHANYSMKTCFHLVHIWSRLVPEATQGAATCTRNHPQAHRARGLGQNRWPCRLPGVQPHGQDVYVPPSPSSHPHSPEPLLLQQLPLFPLQTVLFPGGWLPLRIFEVRYLDMIKRCHQAGAPFGVVCLSEGTEVRRADPAAPPGGDGFAREVFHPVGTLARIESLDRPQPGLMMVRCQGLQRFEVTARRQLPHGLWVGDVKLFAADPAVPVIEPLLPVRQALQRLLESLQERDPDSLANLPLQPPYQWDDSGWVANRWLELLPVPNDIKLRLMALDNPLVRLELVADLLEKLNLKI